MLVSYWSFPRRRPHFEYWQLATRRFSSTQSYLTDGLRFPTSLLVMFKYAASLRAVVPGVSIAAANQRLANVIARSTTRPAGTTTTATEFLRYPPLCDHAMSYLRTATPRLKFLPLSRPILRVISSLQIQSFAAPFSRSSISLLMEDTSDLFEYTSGRWLSVSLFLYVPLVY